MGPSLCQVWNIIFLDNTKVRYRRVSNPIDLRMRAKQFAHSPHRPVLVVRSLAGFEW